MAVVALTRLRLRAYRYLLPFAWRSRQSARQAQRTPGFLAGRLYGDPLRLTFWTVTAWESEAAMHAFRGTGDHQRIMPKLAHWCDEASVAHWAQSSSDIPEPDELLARMCADGRLSRVRHPSADHAAGRVAADGRAPAPGPLLHPVRR